MSMNRCSLQCEECVSSDTISLSQVEIETLEFRFSFPVLSLCKKHYDDQFKRYIGWQYKCCDPRGGHSKAIKSDLRTISLCFAQDISKFTEYRVIPGQKLCKRCQSFLSYMVDSSKVVDEQNLDLQREEKMVVSDIENDAQDSPDLFDSQR